MSVKCCYLCVVVINLKGIFLMLVSGLDFAIIIMAMQWRSVWFFTGQTD